LCSEFPARHIAVVTACSDPRIDHENDDDLLEPVMKLRKVNVRRQQLKQRQLADRRAKAVLAPRKKK
jgi:hypothetical protein